jgi:hypothetical protein
VSFIMPESSFSILTTQEIQSTQPTLW